MRILHLMSCRGWSSDAYWAARAASELERAGHHVTLVCKRGTEEPVIERARQAGAGRIDTLSFTSGIKPGRDVADLRRLIRWLPHTDVVHVHRGKEHWLAALANRWGHSRRPLVRTRHIVQAVRSHALNRWLYQSATDLVVTVTDAIRHQYVAADLISPDRVVTLHGGADRQRFHPGVDGAPFRRSLSIDDRMPLIGLVSGFRVMKGHAVVLDAAVRLKHAGRRFHIVFLGRGAMEVVVRDGVARAGLSDRASFMGLVPDLPGAMAALDVALYPPLESDGMSRVLFEYLAMGKPVVASRVGAAPEALVDGETALLVPAGEPRPLALALTRLLEDPALRDKLSRSAAELTASRVCGARVAARLATLYSELVEGGRGRSR